MVSDSQQIPDGYKQTDVGVIPEDWDEKQLSLTSTLKARIGWQGLTTAEYLNSGDYFLITGTDFKDGFIDWENCCYVEKNRYDQDKNIQVKIDDVLVTKDGTIGKVAYVDALPKKATLNSGVFVIRPKNHLYDPKYFYYLLRSFYFEMYLSQLAAGSTINHLYQKDFVNFSFPYPKEKEEQNKIAQAIFSIDSLISKLDQLIQKKKNIKQGAMQELLTGKRRLPGFSGEWEMRQLIEIANFYDNYRIPVTESKRQKGTTPYYGANGIQGYIKGHTHDGEFVLMAEDGANDLNNYPVIYVEGKVWVNNHAHVIQGIDGYAKTKYLSYALKTVNFVQVLVGGTRAKLNGSVAKSINILIPTDMFEQTAIAQVLSDMDTKIESLEKQKAKYNDLKQGMMQQLLTGKIRLI
jgi:type I restriction enzyme, S subunit